MIVWKGFGILTFVVPFVLLMLFTGLIGNENFYVFISLVIAGLINWFIGRNANAMPPKMKQDENGQLSEYKAVHSFFFIKMEYWTIPMLAYGLYGVITHFDFQLLKNLIVPLLGIFAAIGVALFLYKKYNSSEGKQPEMVNSNTRKEFANQGFNKIDELDKNESDSKFDFFKNKNEVKESVAKKDNPRVSSENKKAFDEIRANHKTVKDFGTSDHSKYFPKPLKAVGGSFLKKDVVKEEE